MKSGMKPAATGNGFTLVEVLIGLTLFGLILLMLYSNLYTSTRTWETSDRQSEKNDDIRLVLSFLRRQINQTVPILYMDEGKNRSLFTGGRDAMEFVSRLPAHRGGGGLHLVKLFVAAAGDGGVLLFKYLPLNADLEAIDDETNKMVKSVELLKGIKDIQLAYYGRAKDDNDPAWHDEWNNPDQLPLLIRLQIDADDPDEFWPELLISVPAQMERGQPQLALIKPGPGRQL